MQRGNQESTFERKLRYFKTIRKKTLREIYDKTSLKILAETNLKIEIALHKLARNC